MSAHVDRFLSWIKWPFGVLCLLLLPGAAWALAGVFRAIGEDFAAMLPFFGGFAAYFAVWWLLLRRPAIGSWLSTLEHEMTHALLAWLTLHRVTGLRSSWRDGGEITFRGKGNWLIVVAPYFFPTVSVIVAVVLLLVPEELATWLAAILGGTVAYHMTSTWIETHGRQTDLKKVTWPFAIMLLPTANVAFYGLLLAVAAGGGGLAVEYVRDVGRHTVGLYEGIF